MRCVPSGPFEMFWQGQHLTSSAHLRVQALMGHSTSISVSAARGQLKARARQTSEDTSADMTI